MRDILSIAGHRPYPMPERRWRMRQRWNDLLFAHWPVRKEAVSGLLPAGVEVDTLDDWAGALDAVTRGTVIKAALRP